MSEVLHERVRWDLQDTVARITLVGSPANTLGMAAARGLRAAADRVAQGADDGSIRVAVLAADGKMFSAGGDLHEFSSASDTGGHTMRVADELHHAILTLTRAPVPVVSIVHGTVAGGGIGVALAADVVLMAAEAKIRVAYTAVGLSPDCGISWVLARRLGTARALDLALTNRILTGGEAAACGLVSRAVPAGELQAVAEGIIADLRSGPTGVYGQTKRLIYSDADRDLAAQLDDESATIGRLIGGAEGTEGVDAFLNKRTPRFDTSKDSPRT